MNKANLLIVFLCLGFYACDKQEIALISASEDNSHGNKDSSIIVPGKDSTAVIPGNGGEIIDTVNVNPSNNFNFIFKLNFENTQSGLYSKNDWSKDWNSPSWANHDIGYGNILADKDGKYLQEVFPKGTFLLTNVGTQWLARLDKGYDELYLSYKIKFSKGFTNTNYHGKLPGLGGGDCAGAGNLPDGTDGWSSRYMFHATALNFYLYYPDLYKQYGDAVPIAGKKYYGCGPELKPGYDLRPEVWYTITQRIVLNTPGKQDGIAEGFVNGKLCAQQKGIRFRDLSSLKIEYIFFANFFGGSGNAPLADENICFDDFYVYSYADDVKATRGNMANTMGTVIPIP